MRVYDQNGVMLWIGTAESAHDFLAQVNELNHYEVHGVPNSVMERLGLSAGDREDERFGEYADFIQMEGNVAVVPVKGKLADKESWLTRLFGIMTYETMSNILATLVNDGGVEAVMLDVDSPGGMAKGIDIASDAIKATREAGLTVQSHTSGQMASAAFWVGTTAETVGASKYAEVGSVGVIAVHTEYTEAFKKEGIKHTVLRKGDKKALATPFEKLSPAAKAEIDNSMERSYQAFIDQVTENTGLPRDYVASNVATGEMFTASDATDMGLIDEVISYNDMMNQLVADTGGDASSNTNPSSNWSKAAMTNKPRQQAGSLSAEEAATAVAAGVPGVTIPAPPAAPAPAADAGDQPAEVTLTDGTPGDEEPPAGETDTTASGSEPNAGDQPPAEPQAQPAAQQSADNSAFASVIADLNKQLVDTRVELSASQQKVASLEAGNAGFRKIAIAQTQNMRVALGLSGDTADLERMSDESIVTAHDEVRTKYLEHFNVGARSQVPDQDTPLPQAASSRVDRAVQRLTSIK